jgi:hypothetical protein
MSFKGRWKCTLILFLSLLTYYFTIQKGVATIEDGETSSEQ